MNRDMTGDITLSVDLSFFFFSSRRRHTRCSRDWSSDVCSSDLNTPEFLMAYETDNLLTGKTSNPWNLKYSAGGSSGGEAAAIAAGCSMGGVGSEIGRASCRERV